MRGSGKPSMGGLGAVVALAALLACPAAVAGNSPLHAMGSALPNARWFYPAVWTGSDVILFGGGDTNAAGADRILLYDVAQDRLTATHTTLYPLGGSQSAVWMAGAAYVFSADGQGQIVRYDPARDSAQVLPARIPLYSSGGAVTAVTDGHVAYLFGGESPSYPNDRIFRFDPAAPDTVTVMRETLPQSNREMAAVWAGNAVYLMGGAQPPANQIVRYDPRQGVVSTQKSVLPVATRDQAALWDGAAIYVFGGDASSAGFGPVATILRYDPESGAVSLAGSTPAPVSYLPAAWTEHQMCLFGGRAGGDQASTQILCTGNLTPGSLGAACAKLPWLPFPFFGPLSQAPSDCLAPLLGPGAPHGVPPSKAAAHCTLPTPWQGEFVGAFTGSCVSCPPPGCVGSPLVPARLAGQAPSARAALSPLATAAIAALSVAALGAALWPLLRRTPWVLPLFSRILPDRALDHEARRRIVEIVKEKQGIHLQALVGELGLARATAEHHVRVLLAHRLIHERRIGRYRCYFLGVAHKLASAPPRVTLRSQYARDILRQASALPGSSVSTIAHAIQAPPRVVSYHVQRLAEAGLLRLDHRGRFTKAYPTERAIVFCSEEAIATTALEAPAHEAALEGTAATALVL
ncbi:MAG: hypothetical protein ACYDBQ_05525 [Thermoplasmatota archaeon]